MIKSMTGYGNATKEIDGRKITVEIKSVNSRYGDYNIKVPRAYSFLEEPIRGIIGKVVSRAKAEVYVSVENFSTEEKEVRVNHGVLKGYLKALEEISSTYNLPNNVTALQVSNFSDVLKAEKTEEDDEKLIKEVTEVFFEAGDTYNKTRETEGEKLVADIKSHLDVIYNRTLEVEKRAPSIVSEYKERLKTRMEEILQGVPVDEARLLNEVAIFSDRVNVNEEIVRLKSHVAQLNDILSLDGVIGRKTDFLVQEMNREINTIGSKSNDLETAGIVIDVKAEIEKIREQIQNIE